MMFRFVVDVPLRWVDVDSEGVVNNAVYLSLVEHARFLYFEELGLLQQHRVEFLLAEATVRFKNPGRLGMRTEVAVRTTELGTTSFRMEYEVKSGDLLLATVSAVLVFVDGQKRPRPIPDPVRDAITVFEDLGAAG